MTSAEGREAYAAAMDVASSMAAVAKSGMTLDELIGSLPANLQGAFQLMSAGSQDTAATMKQAASAVSSASSTAGQSLNSLGSAISSVASTAANAARMASSAANAAANAASNAGSAANAAASAANTAASAASNASSAASGHSHFTGAFNIPRDNYPANLHKNEMVIPAQLAGALRQGIPLQLIKGGRDIKDIRPVDKTRRKTVPLQLLQGGRSSTTVSPEQTENNKRVLALFAAGAIAAAPVAAAAGKNIPPAAAPVTINATINVQATPGMDEAAVARKITEELNRLRIEAERVQRGQLYERAG